MCTVAAERSFSRGRQEAAPHAAGRQPGHPPARGRAGRAALRPVVAQRRPDRSRASASGVRQPAAAAGRRRGSRPSASCSRFGAAALSSAPTRRQYTRCCRFIERFAQGAPAGPRRSPPRPRRAQIAAEMLNRSLDFGVLTFQPADRGAAVDRARRRRAGDARASRASARRPERVDDRGGRAQTVIAHNDPSPARDRVLRAVRARHAPINIQVALPSLDGIKRAVEMGMGVAVLPRRCALTRSPRPARGDQGSRAQRPPPGPPGLPAEASYRTPPTPSSRSCARQRFRLRLRLAERHAQLPA